MENEGDGLSFFIFNLFTIELASNKFSAVKYKEGE
jgi:hypothetical protein